MKRLHVSYFLIKKARLFVNIVNTKDILHQFQDSLDCIYWKTVIDYFK